MKVKIYGEANGDKIVAEDEATRAASEKPDAEYAAQQAAERKTKRDAAIAKYPELEGLI